MLGVAIVSGGMDSVTMAHMLRDAGDDLHILSFNYGQRHNKELDYAADCATELQSPWRLVDLTNITELISNSSLTNSNIDVPEGHYAEETMKATVVPNRNAIMLNVAAGYAVNIQADYIATAVHSGDHAIYPDCRPEFIEALEQMLLIANEGFIKDTFKVFAPFVHIPKQDIVSIGVKLVDYPVDYQQTWTCYKGGEWHCGKCGTCVERIEAFQLAGVPDPTIYEGEYDGD